jgi:hypothetical protein
MPRSTEIIPIRLRKEIAARVREAAAATGRATSKYIGDILASAVGLPPGGRT